MARVVMARGLIATLQPGEFDYYWNTTTMPLVISANIELADTRSGDWLYFGNNEGYHKVHPSGGYIGENVIATATQGDKYWGWPGSDKTGHDNSYEEWKGALCYAYNNDPPAPPVKQISVSNIPGYYRALVQRT